MGLEQLAKLQPNGLVSNSTQTDLRLPMGQPSPMMSNPQQPSDPYVPQDSDPLGTLAQLSAQDKATNLQKQALQTKAGVKPLGLAPRPGASALALLADAIFNHGRGDLAGGFFKGFADDRQRQNQENQQNADTQSQMQMLDAQNELNKANITANDKRFAATTQTKKEQQQQTQWSRLETAYNQANTPSEKRAAGRKWQLSGDPSAVAADVLETDATTLEAASLQKANKAIQDLATARGDFGGELTDADVADLQNQATLQEKMLGLKPGSVSVPMSHTALKKTIADQKVQEWTSEMKFKSEDAKKKWEKWANDQANKEADIEISKKRLNVLYQNAETAAKNADTGRYNAMLNAYNSERKFYLQQATNHNTQLQQKIKANADEMGKILTRINHLDANKFSAPQARQYAKDQYNDLQNENAVLTKQMTDVSAVPDLNAGQAPAAPPTAAQITLPPADGWAQGPIGNGGAQVTPLPDPGVGRGPIRTPLHPKKTKSGTSYTVVSGG